jgi:transcriptional regulator with XRE-family HTH domain
MEPIGTTVKRLRIASGMTQQDLAVKAGLSIAAVSQIEQGTNNDPRATTLRKLAAALGVTVDAIVNPPEGEATESPKPRRKRRKD